MVIKVTELEESILLAKSDVFNFVIPILLGEVEYYKNICEQTIIPLTSEAKQSLKTSAVLNISKNREFNEEEKKKNNLIIEHVNKYKNTDSLWEC